MSERIDFSGNAGIYDRRHGAAIPSDGLDQLCEVSRLVPPARVLDLGAGTGRIAIPLARRGFRVVAVEPASGMLAELTAKAAHSVLHVAAAEGASLPFGDGRFDVVVIARLLYLTSDWHAIVREARRVLADGGCLLHEWGNGDPGEEWAQIRDEARRLFEMAGVVAPFHPGARSEAEVDEFIAALRWRREAQVDLGAGPLVTLGEFLRRLVEGELSYIWNVPDEARAQSVPALQRWAAQTFDLKGAYPMPRNLRWTVYRKDATQP